MRPQVILRTRFWFNILSAISLFSLVVITTVYIQIDRYFDSYINIPPKITTKKLGTNIKVGIVGDSWVAGQKLDQAVQATINSDGFDTTIISSGQPGAKSRQIYRNLISEKSNPFSSNYILMDEDLDYLIVVAGVNDTAGHIGCDFYTHHMLCIIKTAQVRGIYPVIVEVPEYGIEATPAENPLSYTKRLLYRIIFDDMNQDVIEKYRKSLRELLAAEKIKDISVVSFSSIANDYSEHTDLYANPSHLNDEGYKQLGCEIGANIVTLQTSRLQELDEKIQTTFIGEQPK